MNAKAEITEMAVRHIARCDKVIVKFADQFAENPLHALEWGDAMVTAVAEKNVWTKLANALARPGTEIDAVLKGMNEAILMQASTPETSSNAMGNVVRRADIAAMASIYRDMKMYLG